MSNERVKPVFEDPSASPELRSFVAMARSDGPTEAELDHLAKRLAPVLGVSAGLAIAGQAAAVASVGSAPAGVTLGGASAGTATSVFPPAAAAGLSAGAGAAAVKGGILGQVLASTGAKLVALGLSVGVAGVGAWELRGADPRDRGPSVPAETPGAALPPGAPAASGVVAAPQPVGEPVQPAAVVAAPQLVVEPVEPARQLVAGARAHSARAALLKPKQPASATPAPAASVELPAPQPAAEVAPAPVVEPPPSELALIRHAQAQRAHYGQALALLAQHEQLYPLGALSQEREILAIEILLKAGSRAQAEARAARFRAIYPGSAHMPHLTALLARAAAK